jgi:NADPH2:quinone reductase
MKAVIAHAYGPPESLVLENHTGRSPARGEVRVRLHWAGLSFVDVLVAAGKHQHRPTLPFVPGSEFSGTVLEVGDGVSHVAPGDPVCGGNMGGILAQDITLPAVRMQKLEDKMRLQQAAVLRASYLTAWYALVERGALARGETVLVLGGAGAVGIAACQIARFLGATVIASASSTAKRRFAEEQGAHTSIETGAPDWRDQVRMLTSGRGPDVVVDPVGGAATERALRSLAYRGRHLMVGFASGDIPAIPANLPLLKGVSLTGVLVSLFLEHQPESAAAARSKILQLFCEGVLRPPVGRIYPLGEYIAAMQAAAGAEVLGRVLLDMR